MSRVILKSTTTNARRSSRRAMTLVELLMVMVIMAIILSVSLPALNSMGRGGNLRSAVSDVRNTVAQARQWAITHRVNVSFCYVTAASSAYYYVRDDYGMILETNALPPSIRFLNNGSVSSVTFKTDGSLASGAGSTLIVSLVGSNGTRTIHVNGLTGGISVQ